MRTPSQVVRSFFEAMQARAWDDAAAHLSPTVRIDFTETGERFDGPNFIAMNEAYPDGWTIDVVETFEDGARAAAHVRVTTDEHVFWCAGFYSVHDGVIVSGTEHWVTERSQPPPDWRERYSTRNGGGSPSTSSSMEPQSG